MEEEELSLALSPFLQGLMEGRWMLLLPTSLQAVGPPLQELGSGEKDPLGTKVMAGRERKGPGGASGAELMVGWEMCRTKGSEHPPQRSGCAARTDTSWMGRNSSKQCSKASTPLPSEREKPSRETPLGFGRGKGPESTSLQALLYPGGASSAPGRPG